MDDFDIKALDEQIETKLTDGQEEDLMAQLEQ